MNKTIDMAPDNDFGKWLHTNMVERNLTCVDVAEMLHSTRQTIRNHINGFTNPSYVWVVAYCSIFDDSPAIIWQMV